MERKAFFRPADEFSMTPLSESEGEEIFTASQQKAMAAKARRQGSFTSSFVKEKPQPKAGRQLWADITTDDEDNFPVWTPAPKVQEEEVQKPAQSRALDKTSWSTAATDADLEEAMPDDLTPTADSQASFGSSEKPSFSSAAEEPDAQPLRMPTVTPQVAMQPRPVTMPMMSMMQPAPQVQPGMMLAMPAMPYMQLGMGMLPIAMAAAPRLPTQALLTTAVPNGPLSTSPKHEDKDEELVRPAPRMMAGLAGPPFGRSHRFHQKNTSMGVLENDARTFTKKHNKGRLSIVSENKVHFQGTVRYAVQFTDGELCSADGVGFILSSDLPCTKNIQKIVSVFANRTGRICVRVHEEVERCSQSVKCLEVGDWLEVAADLSQQTVSFTVWPQDNSAPSYATVSFKDILNRARGRVNGLPRNPCGYLAVVMKHVGVSVTFGS
mmetsp:Transcript_36647/g.84506  ORF Transcript_36647/g.84506 Transcript_36647/m.84506 type:complete len:437 (-) Transcript_36647:204-1514(-)